jgi:hypothetical protein
MPYVYWHCGPFAISVSKPGLLVCWNDHAVGYRLSILGWLKRADRNRNARRPL